MKWRPKNFGDSLLPITTIRAIIGRGIFHYPPGRQHPKFSIIYAITSTLLIYGTMAFVMKDTFESSWYHHEGDPFFYIIYFNIATGTLDQILSWHHVKRSTNFVEKMTKLDQTLQQLGTTFDYTRTLNFGIVMMIFWFFIMGILNAIDISWVVSLVPLKNTLMIVTILHYPLHINSFVILNFAKMIGLIGIRFRKMNELLEKIAKPKIRQPIDNQAWQYLRKEVSVATIRISKTRILQDAAYKKHVIQIIKQAHLELTVIAKDSDNFFGIQIILEFSAYFVLVIILLCDLYTVASNPTTPRRYLRIFVQCFWCTTYLAKIILVNRVCGVVSAEAYRTGDILHSMAKMHGDPEMPDEIEQFSLQIMQNRIFFKPAGIIILGWTFVRGFIGTVTMYLIIIIQQNSSE